MTIPSLLFALLIAMLYGSIYHLIRGGGIGRLVFCFGLSVIGFAAGHLVGLWQGWFLLAFGSLNLGVSSMGSILFLMTGDWLNRMETRRESKV